jgi:uncharacterized damage-inducible protein DinB
MQSYFLKLFHYEYWANKKVLDQLLLLNTPPAKSVALFSHVLFAHKIWLSRIGAPQEDIREDYGVEELLDVLDNNYIELITYIKKHTDLSINITYKDLKENVHHNQLTDILSHLITHGAYHRGQIIQLLKTQTEERIMTDYILYARLEL